MAKAWAGCYLLAARTGQGRFGHRGGQDTTCPKLLACYRLRLLFTWEEGVDSSRSSLNHRATFPTNRYSRFHQDFLNPTPGLRCSKQVRLLQPSLAGQDMTSVTAIPLSRCRWQSHSHSACRGCNAIGESHNVVYHANGSFSCESSTISTNPAQFGR